MLVSLIFYLYTHDRYLTGPQRIQYIAHMTSDLVITALFAIRQNLNIIYAWKNVAQSCPKHQCAPAEHIHDCSQSITVTLWQTCSESHPVNIFTKGTLSVSLKNHGLLNDYPSIYQGCNIFPQSCTSRKRLFSFF